MIATVLEDVSGSDGVLDVAGRHILISAKRCSFNIFRSGHQYVCEVVREIHDLQPIDIFQEQSTHTIYLLIWCSGRVSITNPKEGHG